MTAVTHVRDLMSPVAEFVPAGATMREAAQKMRDKSVHCLLVAPDEAGAWPGIVTCKDVVQVFGDEGEAALDELLVRDVMSSPVVSVSPSMRTIDAVNLMRMTGIRRAPVMDGDEVVGVLSFTDVLRALAGA